MRFVLNVVAAAIGIASIAALSASAYEGMPLWAWGYASAPGDTAPPLVTRPPPPVLDNTMKHTVPGSKQAYTRAELLNRFDPADWFPEEHPKAPDIVSHGRQSGRSPIYACTLCHLSNGLGRPENANLAGLPEVYFIQQMKDFQDDRRNSSDRRKTNALVMVEIAKAMNEEEIRASAAYFSALPVEKRTTVVESEAAPKTEPRGGVFVPLTGQNKGFEPLGARIIETPTNPEQSEIWRDPHSGFTAYVPIGSLGRGRRLVAGGAAIPCATCHGHDLRGAGAVPPLAGRSPSYIARQLWDMQQGSRKGPASAAMAALVAKLTSADMLDISAYLASLKP